jgi:hypothetical protein
MLIAAVLVVFILIKFIRDLNYILEGTDIYTSDT